jgi:hypothetical protein
MGARDYNYFFSKYFTLLDKRLDKALVVTAI